MTQMRQLVQSGQITPVLVDKIDHVANNITHLNSRLDTLETDHPQGTSHTPDCHVNFLTTEAGDNIHKDKVRQSIDQLNTKIESLECKIVSSVIISTICSTVALAVYVLYR